MCDLNAQMAYQKAQISTEAKISLQDDLGETRASKPSENQGFLNSEDCYWDHKSRKQRYM